MEAVASASLKYLLILQLHRKVNSAGESLYSPAMKIPKQLYIGATPRRVAEALLLADVVSLHGSEL